MSANTPLTFGPPECLHSYASELYTYFEMQVSSDRFFTPFEQSQMYLDGLKTNTKYHATATTLLRRLQEIQIQGLPLPPTLNLNDIPGTVLAEHHLSTPPSVPGSTATIHAAQASCQGRYNKSGPPRGNPGSDRRPLLNAQNERIASVRPVALTAINPQNVIFCRAYSTASSITTATQHNAKTLSADTTPETAPRSMTST
jgi:hypothetical protein